MTHSHKTKAELISELAATQQQVSELETQLNAYAQERAEYETSLAAENDRRVLAETLLQINAVLSQSLNYEMVLDGILEQASRLVSYDAACLMLVEGNVARVFRWQGYSRYGGDDFFGPLVFHISTNERLRAVQETGVPLVIPFVEDYGLPIYGFEQDWIKSHLSVPLILQEQIIGFLNLDSTTPGFFDQEDADRLQAFTNLAVIALKNTQLYDQARQTIMERVKALKKERNFAAAVLDTAGALVMVLNPKGRILRFNRTCEQMTGYEFEEVKGKCFWDIFLTSDQVPYVKSVFEKLLAGVTRNEYEGYWFTKDRRKRLIAWSNTVLLDSEGVVEYIISSGVDVTERRQLSDRLAAIHYMGQELNLLRDQDAILDITLETAAFLLQFRSAGYGLVDEAYGQLKYSYRPVRGVPNTLELELPLEADRRIDELLAYCEQSTDIINPADTLRVFQTFGDVHRSWLSVQMKTGDNVIGVLDVESNEPDQFTDNDRQLLQTLADQTAVALENAQLHHQAQQRLDELSSMNMISQAITSTLDLEETLTIVTDNAIRLLEASAASVVLHDPDRGDLWFNTASGGDVSDFLRGQRLGAGKGIVGWVIEHGESALVPDVSQDPRFYGEVDQRTGFTTRSIICVPMQTREETIGAIEVMNKTSGTFTNRDLRLLNLLSSPAAIAIQNARLFEQVQIGHNRLQSLSRRLVEVQETERGLIARELHDEAGQALTALMVELRLLEREAHNPEAVVTQVAELKAKTNDILENLHQLAINLRPASLDHVGLVAALRQYIKTFSQQNDLDTQFEVVGLDDNRLAPEVETNLYRIVQEALTNVVRHAAATRVDVLLEIRGEQLITIIEDNGTGFDPQAERQNSRLGLVGIRERAEMLDGKLVIESTPDTGTTIYVEVPYNEHKNSDS